MTDDTTQPEQPDEAVPEAAAHAAAPGGESADVEEIDAGPTMEERAAADTRTREELFAALEEAEFASQDALMRSEGYLDALQRRQAEFENFRKRTLREQQQQRVAGIGELATSVIEVLDDLDAAVTQAQKAVGGSEDPTGLLHGVALVRDKLLSALSSKGVTRIDEVDVAFDPSRHDAVQQIAADGGDQPDTVAVVFRAGYALGDRVLRAAMVVVRQ